MNDSFVILLGAHIVYFTDSAPDVIDTEFLLNDGGGAVFNDASSVE